MIKSLLIKVTAVCIGLVLLIRLLSISEGIPVSILTRPEPRLDELMQVIKVNPRHAYAHEQIAWQKYTQGNYDIAKTQALETLANNPSSGMAMSILMMVLDQEKHTGLATQAAQLSAHLWPAHDLSIWLVADFWVKNNNIEKAMKAWNIVLQQQPQGEYFASSRAATRIFPVLNKLAQYENSSQLFQPYHANPPSWWSEFFQYMVKQPNNLEAVERFYQQARLNGNTDKKNRQLYISKLISENHWQKAHDIWEKALPDDKAEFAGLIYDGSFESRYINEEFNWMLTDKNNIQVYFDTYSKKEGLRSLRIAFNTWIDDYWGFIRQYLVLTPGNYSLSFQSRANLESLAGLKWRVDCFKNKETENESMNITSSELLSGDYDWKEGHFNFTVPQRPDCKAQKLYLILAGENSVESRVRGDIWFDDLKIIKTE